jgi:hypothetical protein
MLTKIAAFEIRYQLRTPLFAVGFIIFFLLAFGSVTIDQVQIGGRGNVNINSPFAILQTLAIMNLFALFVVTAFVANVVIRDDETGFAPILRATQVSKFDYLVGRFSGAIIVAFIVMASVPLGLARSRRYRINPRNFFPTCSCMIWARSVMASSKARPRGATFELLRCGVCVLALHFFTMVG